MIEINFKINGRKVNPKNMKDVFEAAALDSIDQSIKKSVGNIRCSEHGQSPKIQVIGRSIDNLSFNVSGCCESLIEKVSDKFK